MFGTELEQLYLKGPRNLLQSVSRVARRGLAAPCRVTREPYKNLESQNSCLRILSWTNRQPPHGKQTDALFENMDKLFKRFRKPPKAILPFADDMTNAGKK